MGTVVPLSTDQYHAILQATPDGFAVLSRDGQILDVNDAYCELTGYRRKELLRMRLQDLVAGDGFREARPAIESILAGGKAKFELSHRHKAGHVLLVEISGCCIDVSEKRVYLFVRDITARRQAEEALRESAEKFFKIYDSSSD